MQNGECQAINGFIYWGYFAKIHYMSSRVMVAWLKIKGIIKTKIGNSLKLNARLHVVIERGYKDEHRFDGP
jgi:hypothetical protein